MNYIRGAVNVISAPYQYYKDLPPINPSTLTGAIDVIVVQRPTGDGGTELACSPFHVRFGKWQVLRPGEKKVDVSVNGHLIPFHMKIGEAGEAFFVFETDDEVPEDLITSPILQPTRPDETAANDAGVPSDRFGVEQDPDDKHDTQPDHEGHIHTNEEELRRQDPDTQEPEFLDLNAPPSPPSQNEDEDETFKNVNTTPKPIFTRPSIPQNRSHMSISLPAQTLPSPPPTPDHLRKARPASMTSPDQRVDEVLKTSHREFYTPEVEYHHDIALDAEGYHAHNRERSDRTVRTSEEHPFPSNDGARSTTPSPVRRQSSANTERLYTFPTFRATSEPPPDVEDHCESQPPSHDQPPSQTLSKLNILTPVQEYSWEWGAFPQPSPITTSFGKGGRIEGSLSRKWAKGKGKAKTGIDFSDSTLIEYEEDPSAESEHGRSRSVPPEWEGSPARERRIRELPEDHEDPPNYEETGGSRDEVRDKDAREDLEIPGFGTGGKLTPASTDPTLFILSIEGRKATFELSLVSHREGEAGNESEPEEGERARGRKNRHGGVGGPNFFDGRGEVEAARLFSQGKISFDRFLNEDDLVDNPKLVIRWAGNQYITRNDGSPLMHALTVWRDEARKSNETLIRSSSPESGEENEVMEPLSSPSSVEEDVQVPDRMHHRSKSEPPEKPPGKPVSSSWTQWWSRSRRTKPSTRTNNTDYDSAKPMAGKSERPSLRETTSAPLSVTTHPPSNLEPFDINQALKEVPPAESAPALPSTPIQSLVKEPPVARLPPPMKQRKFAKTLRLTSDQLKTLNLKPGANTITFSLSTSGAIACTARIFVWDSTDLVVISDIDGTITKSDGLGHVFAMIGRDWTHLGVAKLYTDITRNGYKIMYLTSRAIGQADATRDYLKGIKQNDYQLPEGPVIMSPDRLMASLHREVIMRKPEVFKMACLRDIQRLFGEASRNPFSAGFGNRITDAMSYRSVNVPSARIFTIDSSGEVKMELLELAGYKSSYIHMTDLVDQMFPPIHRKWTPEFTDFNYWKVPVQDFPLPDFSPPSPALSARSDTSNQSTLARLRNFSLVGNRQGTLRQVSPTRDMSENDKSSDLRQMSSFEKLSNTFGSMIGGDRRSASPASHSSASYDSDDEDADVEIGLDGKARRRERRRSMTSMPGTLDEMHFGMDDDDENYDHYEGDGAEGDIAENEGDVGDEDEAFDENLLAAVEMKNVPFL